MPRRSPRSARPSRSGESSEGPVGGRVGSVWATGLTLPISGRPTRHAAVTAKAEEAAGLLEDNHELQTFLQSCQEVGMRHSRWRRGGPG